MANVLIASLGESPIVVTSMVKALKKKAGIELDRVIVVYPAEHENITYGVGLIESHCLCRKIEPCGLPFPDVNTTRRCYLFLQTLYGLLEANQQDTVYLSIAGGRKTMSALMYLFAPFYENIKGVYHILDKNEGINGKRNFHCLEDLLNIRLDAPKLKDIMNPPSDELNLIEIRFEHFANADELRRILKSDDSDSPLESASVNLDQLSDEAFAFWSPIFQKRGLVEFYDIVFSENAKKQFESPQANKINFSRYFSSSKLKHPDWTNKSGGKHLTFEGKDRTRFHIAKIGKTAERIAWWYNSANKQVVIAELAVEEEEHGGKYYRLGTGSVLNKVYFSGKSATDYMPVCKLNEMISYQKVILLAAVGESPMVVTQAYTLLRRKENANIDKVAVVFPEQNAGIKTGVLILEDVFRKKAEVIKYGAALKDVDSQDNCKIFLDRIIATIDDLKKKYPDSEIRMLLSGGRKAMTAFSYFAAQRSHIAKVYHTLITDTELEDKIEEECSIENLNRLGSTKKKAEKMFLESYPEQYFDRFEIPVIPLGR